MGEVGLDGGEVAMLSRSSRLARALYETKIRLVCCLKGNEGGVPFISEAIWK
jgi:hypothetical protein